MITVTVKLKSVASYQYSRFHNTPKEEKESAADYEDRTWRNKAHINEKGQCFVPPMALKNCLSEAAKFLSMQIPGKGKATYTKHFEAGVLCIDPMLLNKSEKEIERLDLFVPASGRRGDGKRVIKTFPILKSWEGTAIFFVLDETITQEVFRYHMEQAGKFIGIGAFRPRNNGFFGRFAVTDLSADQKWK
jgi:hypothetical protein